MPPWAFLGIHHRFTRHGDPLCRGGTATFAAAARAAVSLRIKIPTGTRPTDRLAFSGLLRRSDRESRSGPAGQGGDVVFATGNDAKFGGSGLCVGLENRSRYRSPHDRVRGPRSWRLPRRWSAGRIAWADHRHAWPTDPTPAADGTGPFSLAGDRPLAVQNGSPVVKTLKVFSSPL